MKVNVTFRHMEADDELREYVEEKITRLCDKYFQRPQDAVVVFTAEKFRRVAEVTLRVDNTVLNGKEEKDDARMALDLVLDKLETQAKKYRGKFKVRKRGADAGPGPAGADDDRGDDGERVAQVVLDDAFVPKPLTVDDAVLALADSGDLFIVFRNAEDMEICVLYNRPDGDYGLIQTRG